MKRFVLMPDSFKGTMSSQRICDLMEQAIREIYPDAQILKIPVADGGEGSVDAFLSAVGGERRSADVAGPYFERMQAAYGALHGGTVAVVETAACAGLPLVNDRKDPSRTTTYGVGELIVRAAEGGAEKIIVGLGGSATNDMGTGAAAAAGVRFYDRAGKAYIPTGATLEALTRVDVSGLSPALRGVEVVAMCDIDNPLCGDDGAAAVFAPQKGADAKMVKRLDAGLAHAAEVVRRDLGIDVRALRGAGAAGGMGAGMTAFFGAQLRMGIETVLDVVRFDALARGADAVFTGEGRFDTQSLHGKAVIGIAGRAKALGVPVVAVVGDIGDGIDEAYGRGVTALFSINRVALDRQLAKQRSADDLRRTMGDILRAMRAAQQRL